MKCEGRESAGKPSVSEERESDGRLVFHSLLRDVQASVTSPPPSSFSSSSSSSQPPEADVDDEHDDEDAAGRQLGVGGARVQVFGITAVFLGQAGQVAGLRVQSWRDVKNEKINNELVNNKVNETRKNNVLKTSETEDSFCKS